MGEFSFVHWFVVIGIAMMLFGPKKLPEIARSFGEGVREFKKSLKDACVEKVVVHGLFPKTSHHSRKS